MFSGDPQPLEHDRSRESQTHAHFLLLALSRAAQAIQRAHTAEDFYSAVGKEIQSLGGNVALLLLTEDRQSLSIAYLSYPAELIHKAQQMTGLSLYAYQIPITPGGIYERTFQGRTAVYIDFSSNTLKESLPKSIQALSSPLSTIFNLRQGVLAPLWVEDELLGLLKVDGAFLSHDDLPAMDSFAGQIATGLHNIRLLQKLNDELAARKQAEEALMHNRNLLLALGRAANQVQLARELEEIYRVVGEQIRALGFDATILKFDGEKKRLYYQFTSVPVKIIQKAERVVGFKAHDFNWSISEESIYGRVIKDKRSEYVSGGRSLFKEALPDHLHPFAGKLIEMLGIEDGIIAPLHVDDETLGIMIVYGRKRLSREDLPAVDSFAVQVSVCLRNALLAKKVTEELQERGLAEEALRISQSTFEGIFNSVTETIYIQDENGIFLDVNAGAERMYGYPREYFIGRTPEFLSAPGRNDLSKIMGYVQQAFLGQPVEFEFWGVKKDGTIFPKDVHLTAGMYFGRSVVIAVARDITERKEMERKLYESERYYRALIENATDGIMVVDQEGKISYESPSVARMLGYKTGALLGRNAFELIDPDDLARIFETFTSGLRVPGFVHRGEYRLLHSNGDWRYCEIVSHYLIDEPAIMGIIINGRDITERKIAEDALRESESRFHSIVSESTDGIILTDETGHIIEFNSALENITGLKREAVLGMYGWDFQMQLISEPRDEIYQKAKKAFQEMLETGAASNFHSTIEVRIEHPGETRRFVQLRMFSIRTDKGWRLGSIARDITEKKQAEQALRKQFNNLTSLYQMTASLGQSSDLEEVFNTALDSLQNTLDANRAAVLLFDPDGVMRFKSWRGLSEAYRKIAEGHSPWAADDPEPQPVLVPDTFTDPALSHFIPAFESEGIRSLGFIPLVYQGKLLGKFMVYFGEQRDFQEDEVQLAQTIARHVAFAISRQKADDALRASEEKYRILYEDNPSMYFTADENGLVLSVNKYGISQLGFAPEELIGQPIINVFHPEDRASVHLQIELCLGRPEQTVQIEARKIDKSGRIRWVRESACAVRDVQGRLVVLVTCDDVTKRKQAEDELRHANRSLQAAHKELQQLFEHEQTLARTDALTGLFNRRHFFEIAVREFNTAIRYRRYLTIIMFDADGFKKANDAFGHVFGDQILAKISQVTKSQVREVDIPARYGGDEFTVLLPETNAEQALITAERIRKSVESAEIEAGGAPLSITLSLGVAEIDFAADHSVEDIIRRADKALYTAKQAGRNHTVIYSAG